MLLEHERFCGFGICALVTVCSRNTNVLMVWAWVLWSAYALGTRTLFYDMNATVTACSWNTNAVVVWAWMLQRPYGLGTRTLLWIRHGRYSDRMLLEHKRYYGLGMDATVTVCSWNTNLGTRTLYGLGNTLYGLGNGCSGQRMLLKHERSLWFRHGCSGHRVPPDTNIIIVWGLSDRNAIMVWGIDALVTVCSSNTNVLMVWAWVLWSPCALGTRMFS